SHEQVDFACNRRLLDALEELLLLRYDVCTWAQMTNARTAGHWKVLDVARAIGADILRDDAQTFLPEVFTHESYVVPSDIREAGKDPRAAEDLHFDVVSCAARGSILVDLLLHRMAAVSRRAACDVLPSVLTMAARARQHEMIHAADAKSRITDARGHTRAEDGVEHFVLARHVEISREKLDDHLARSIAIAAQTVAPLRRTLQLALSSVHVALRRADKSFGQPT